MRNHGVRAAGRNAARPDVLVITHETTRTGAPKVALRIGSVLADHGLETHMLYRWGGPDMSSFGTAFPLWADPAMRVRAITRRLRSTKNFAGWIEDRAAMHALRTLRPSLVWCNTVYSASYAKAALKLGIPFVLYSHEDPALTASGIARSRIGDLTVADQRGVRFVLAGCSSEVAESVAIATAVPADQVVTLTPGVDIGVDGVGPIVGLGVVGCGQANHIKGVDVFGNAARIHGELRRAKGDPAVRWTWIGRLGDDDLPRRFPDVEFLGEVDDASAHMAGHAVVAFPSRRDQFPLVVLEAMALALPVVATDMRATREQLGEAGIYVPMDDPQSLAATVEHLLVNPDESALLGDRGRARAQTLWSSEVFERSVIEISDRLLARPSISADAAGASSPSGLKSAVRSASKHAAVVSDRLTGAFPRRSTGHGESIVVLAYHRIGPGRPAQMRLDTAMFRDQLDWLGEHCEVIGLGDALSRLAAPPERTGQVRRTAVDDIRPPIVLTFDDGTRDFADIAVSELVDRDLPATLYLATDFVDRDRPWDDGTPAPSWSALADIVSTGLVDIGAHTHTHQLLDRCSPEVAADELDRCNDLIVQHLGVSPQDFAYPKAVLANPANEREIAARYRSAAIAGTRPNCTGSFNPYRLNRSPIQSSDGFTFFVHKANGGMRLEDDIRRTANRLRYRGRTT